MLWKQGAQPPIIAAVHAKCACKLCMHTTCRYWPAAGNCTNCCLLPSFATASHGNAHFYLTFLHDQNIVPSWTLFLIPKTGENVLIVLLKLSLFRYRLKINYIKSNLLLFQNAIHFLLWRWSKERPALVIVCNLTALSLPAPLLFL